MADDKSKTGSPDARTVAAGEPYEVQYFAKKHGLSTQQAEGLIKKFGNNRQVLDQEARKLKGGADTGG